MASAVDVAVGASAVVMTMLADCDVSVYSLWLLVSVETDSEDSTVEYVADASSELELVSISGSSQ